MSNLMTTKEAADYLASTKNTLEQWRKRDEGPPFVKMGRSVRYRKSDLDAWIESRLQNAVKSQPME